MECKECELWNQHEDKRKRKLDKGTCMNVRFAGRVHRTPQITKPDVRCSGGERKRRCSDEKTNTVKS